MVAFPEKCNHLLEIIIRYNNEPIPCKEMTDKTYSNTNFTIAENFLLLSFPFPSSPTSLFVSFPGLFW